MPEVTICPSIPESLFDRLTAYVVKSGCESDLIIAAALVAYLEAQTNVA